MIRRAALTVLTLGLLSRAVLAVPAFPGAEGYGASATGGRGGEVYEVTNLNDAGPGSLRDAVSKPNRTVVFRVSGTINLDSRLEIGVPNITIAGQTAPGDGICLRRHELFIKNTENVIVRFIRSRPGDEAKAEMDAATIWTAKDVILDHCSFSWSTDSLNDVVKESGNVTVQWCIMSEPLVHSVHSKGSHGYATGWDGRTRGGMTAHHNLIAHAASRAPRIGYFKTGRGLIDCRNNVIYNSGPSYGGETDDFNFVGNYFRPGPNYDGKERSVFDVWSGDSRMYAAGNVIEGRDDVLADNAKAIAYKQGSNANGTVKTMPSAEECLRKEPIHVDAPVTTQAAKEAYEAVIRQAGAVAPKRDAVDLRILSDVKNRTGKTIDTPTEVGGWPELKSAPRQPTPITTGCPTNGKRRTA
ncbi:MAG: hypothetical protein QM770_12700 [Tepidisphaeraceae bacterium]